MIADDGSIEAELKKRRGAAYAKLRKYSPVLFDNSRMPRYLKLRLAKAEVIEYATHTWALQKMDLGSFDQTHRHILLRITGFPKSRDSADRLMSYSDVLLLTDQEPLQATIRRRRLLYFGSLLRMDDDRLPKLMLFGELDRPDGTKRDQKGKEKTWCCVVMEDIRDFFPKDFNYLAAAS